MLYENDVLVNVGIINTKNGLRIGSFSDKYSNI